MIDIIYTVTTVNFDQSTYGVFENNGTVQPVLVLSIPVSFDFTIQVDYYSITAISELAVHDYVYINTYV